MIVLSQRAAPYHASGTPFEEITLVCEVEIALSEREAISIARDSLPGWLS